MSIATQISRIQGLVGQLRTNIQNKGVTLANDADLATCVSAVNDISGGGSEPSGYETEYLTFELQGNIDSRYYIGLYIRHFGVSNSSYQVLNFHYYIDYSYDKSTWTTVDGYNSSYNTQVEICRLSSEHPKVYLRSTSNRIKYKYNSSNAYKNEKIIVWDKNLTAEGVKISGNIMSLIFGDDFVGKTFNQPSQFADLFNHNGIKQSYNTYTDASDLILPNCTSEYCYQNMFYNLQKLTAAPKLPATTLQSACYEQMFRQCTGLTSLDSDMIGAVKLGQYSCSSMFYGCTGLTSIPNNFLPATTLATYCYQSMFAGCSGLTSVPADLLPATTLANYCYSSMFQNCSNLANLPNLPATTLAEDCYQSMFNGCTSITSIPNNYLPATTLAADCYSSMFNNCTNLTNTPNLPATTLADFCYANMFYGTKITSLPNLPATTLAQQCYSAMFQNCKSITSIPDSYLPVTTLQQGCYTGMFRQCTGLTTVPANLLPATTLANYCYQNMFYGCTNLATLVNLPATTIATGCYSSMYTGTAITSIPDNYLQATTLAQQCYASMFSGCTALTSVATGLLPATTLVSNCYQQMFYGCTNLETAPYLPATALVSSCYYQMFQGCTKLNYIKALFTTTPSNTYTNNWVSGVASTGTFVKNSAATWTTTGTDAAPSGWTIQYETV